MATADTTTESGLLTALLARLTERLDGWQVGDLSVHLVPERTAAGELQLDVFGEVRQQGPQEDRRCGFFHGYAVPAPNPTDSWVVLNAIELDEDARGRDFARVLVRRILGVVDELGFHRVLVHGFGLGGYLWADAGFRLEHPALPDQQTALSILDQVASRGGLDALDPTDTAQVVLLRDQLATRSGASSPADLLAFADNGPADVRDRRKQLVRTVLAASDWWGVRETNPAERARSDQREGTS
jgi:GNAT superfamily N-acetyltransferase